MRLCLKGGGRATSDLRAISGRRVIIDRRVAAEVSTMTPSLDNTKTTVVLVGNVVAVDAAVVAFPTLVAKAAVKATIKAEVEAAVGGCPNLHSKVSLLNSSLIRRTTAEALFGYINVVTPLFELYIFLGLD
jgi:hypothetical protein